MTEVRERTGHHAATVSLLDDRLRWLSAWTIHNANHLRESRDGLKVGCHQASCASMSTIMAALYFHATRPQDRVAVKLHAAPLLHAAHYLAGNQSLDQLKPVRAFGGMQSYPSRTKNKVPVDFSTGSVGLGVAVTAFASLVGRRGEVSHAPRLLGALSPSGGLVTVVDGHPAPLSWLGAVRGQRVSQLGVERFGQTGDLPDLYAEYGLDVEAIIDAMAEILP